MGKSSRQPPTPTVSKSFLRSLDEDQRKGLICVFVATLIAVSFLLSDGAAQYTRIVEASLAFDGFPEPMPDGKSKSGYELGMRSIIFPSSGIDGMFWVEHAQSMAANGDWRIRRTAVDNAPIGREVHWSQIYLWWLILLGRLRSGLTGESLPICIESMAVFSNALLILMLLILIPFLVFRRFGAVVASMLVVAAATSLGFASAFAMGVPDHHGIAAASVLLCAILLSIAGGGWIDGSTDSKASKEIDQRTTPPSLQAARRWFVASGLVGAVGLWVSAASALPSIASLGLGAVVASRFARPDQRRKFDYASDLWRAWGVAGCVGSIVFYLLEYFPNHLGLRLEVNHPLYALAWLGGGEITARLTDWQANGRKPFVSSLSKAVLVAAGVALLLPVLLVTAIPGKCFWISDRFLWQLHTDYIYEFDSLFVSASMPGNVRFLIWNFLPILFAIVLALRVLLFGKTNRAMKSNVMLILMPTVLTTALGIYQIRWLILANAFAIALLLPSLVALLDRLRHENGGYLERWTIVAGGFVAFGLMPILNVNAGFRQLQASSTIAQHEKALIGIRRTAHFLRRLYPDRKLNVLAGPTTSTELMYFGGIDSLGTLYWENLEGLKAAAEIFSADTPEAFREPAARRGVTHIVLTATDSFLEEYACLWRRWPSDATVNDTFIKSLLLSTDYPVWIRPLYVPNGSRGKDDWIAVFEIDPTQTEATAAYRVGEFLLASDSPVPAIEKYRKSIAADPKSGSPRIGLACALVMLSRREEAWAELERGLQAFDAAEGAVECRKAADFCFQRGFHLEAMKFLERANELVPNHPETINGLARLLSGSNREDVRDVARGLELALSNSAWPDQCEYFRTLALAQAAQGNFPSAVTSIGQAIQSIEPSKFTQLTTGSKSIYLELERYHRGQPTIFPSK